MSDTQLPTPYAVHHTHDGDVDYYTADQMRAYATEAVRERLAQPEQTVSMTEYKRLQDLVTSQGIRLMEYESAQPEHVKFKCTVVDDDHPDGVPLSKWGRHHDQEPFCYHDGRNIVGKEYADHSDVFPLYTAPPAPAKPMTDEDLRNALRTCDPVTIGALRPLWQYVRQFGRAIEAHHGITADSGEVQTAPQPKEGGE